LHGATDAPLRREWIVDGVAREALVHVPAKAKIASTAVIFAFHGHGGTMAGTVRASPYHQLWPDAIVVYPQGLNTPGRLTDPEGKKAGWQPAQGTQKDRDLKFFDAMLASLRLDNRVDDKRIYATGHSNGGSFTYILWAARGDQFAAVAPSAAAADAQLIASCKPKPVLHVAGENDPLVKIEWQQRTIDALKKLNQCGPGERWEKIHTIHPSKVGAPVVTVIHPGTHQYLREAPALIVKFFQQHARP
jgi:polyhydroxybutyrate depolymerase